MAVLKNIIKSIKATGQGVAAVSSGMMNVAKGIANTTGKVANFITGGRREQTYGYTSEFFPMKSKMRSKSKVTQIRPKVYSSLTALPSTQSTQSNDRLSNMFDFMKRMHEQNMTRLEVQNSFAEERQLEEEKRHKELLGAIKDFTNAKSYTPVKPQPEVVKEQKTNLDMLKGMISGMISSFIDGLTWLKELKSLLPLKSLLKIVGSPLLALLTNPLFLGFATAYALANYLAKIMPDYSKVSPEEAKNVLENGSERDIQSFGGREKLLKIISDANESGNTNITVTPQTVTQLNNVPPRPDTTGGKNKARAKSWDFRFAETHNPDGTPKVQTQAKPLPSGVEESTAGAGRGNAALADYQARTLEKETGGKAAFGVKPQGIKAAPIPPAPSPVSNLINENRELEDQTTMTGKVTAPSISVNGSTETVKAPPISSTATLRDDEPMVDRVLQKNRAYV